MRRKTPYLHDRSDWPVFTWRDDTLGAALADVRFRQGRLLGRMEGLGDDLRAEANLETLTSDVIQSSAIEGEILDPESVRSSIARRLGFDPRSRARRPSAQKRVAPRGDRSVEGIVALTIDAIRNYREPLSAERLFTWHRSLFAESRSGARRIIVGKWRTPGSGAMQIVSGALGQERVHFEAPDASRLDEEMLRFFQWFNAAPACDPVLVAGIAHLWFVTIHPFDDGNGRTARAIADMALARADNSAERYYSMSTQIASERSDYYRMLESTQHGTLDITLWLAWFVACLGRAIDRAEITLAGIVRRSQFWRNAETMNINDRQRAVLERLLGDFKGVLTTSKYAKLAKCSPDTALRDINDLLERKILAQNPGGGRAASYRLAEAST